MTRWMKGRWGYEGGREGGVALWRVGGCGRVWERVRIKMEMV